MIHVQREATAMVEEWKENGFKGAYFNECRMEPTSWDDWESDGRTREEYEAFVQDYAIFVADHPFSDELMQEIIRRLGDDVEIKHYPNCSEYECQRLRQQNRRVKNEIPSDHE